MFAKAKAEFDSRRVVVDKWEDLVPTLDRKCVAVLPWCEGSACEDDIKKRSAEMYVSPSLPRSLRMPPLLRAWR